VPTLFEDEPSIGSVLEQEHLCCVDCCVMCGSGLLLSVVKLQMVTMEFNGPTLSTYWGRE
jgi:hypothetical protein